MCYKFDSSENITRAEFVALYIIYRASKLKMLKARISFNLIIFESTKSFSHNVKTNA